MFEQTDGVGESRLGVSGVAGKRGGRFSSRKGENGRPASFRASKKMKAEDGGSVPRGGRQTSETGLWQRLRSFGHHDLQSIAIDRFAGEVSQDHGGTTTTQAEQLSKKKATGASAAHYEEVHIGDGRANDLVARCPAFRNEVGGMRDWMRTEGDVVLSLREGLSHEKKKRVGMRGNLVLNGELPSKELFQQKGPMSDQVNKILQKQTGIYYPFEFIDYGASFYRHYFLGQGTYATAVCVCGDRA